MSVTEVDILAADAQTLVNNPILAKAFADFREALVVQLEDIDITFNEEREKLVLSLQVLKNVRHQLEQYIYEADVKNMTQEEY